VTDDQATRQRGPDHPAPDDVRWEHKEISIPLNVREGLTDKRSRVKVDHIIAARLDEERRQGWEPDESIDLSSLRTRNRVRFRFRWFQGPIYLSVSIRLKRLVQIQNG
jgi:hypothetical protein